MIAELGQGGTPVLSNLIYSDEGEIQLLVGNVKKVAANCKAIRWRRVASDVEYVVRFGDGVIGFIQSGENVPVRKQQSR